MIQKGGANLLTLPGGNFSSEGHRRRGWGSPCHLRSSPQPAPTEGATKSAHWFHSLDIEPVSSSLKWDSDTYLIVSSEAVESTPEHRVPVSRKKMKTNRCEGKKRRKGDKGLALGIREEKRGRGARGIAQKTCKSSE